MAVEVFFLGLLVVAAAAAQALLELMEQLLLVVMGALVLPHQLLAQA